MGSSQEVSGESIGQSPAAERLDWIKLTSTFEGSSDFDDEPCARVDPLVVPTALYLPIIPHITYIVSLPTERGRSGLRTASQLC